MSMNSVNADGHPTGAADGAAPTIPQGVPVGGPPPFPKHAAPTNAAPPAQDRTRQFTADVGDLRLRAPKTMLDTQLMWLGAGLMGLGIVMGVWGYFLSHGTRYVLQQNDAQTLGLAAIPVSILGFALFLRFSLSTFMRFWLARLIAVQQGAQVAPAQDGDATTVLPTIAAGR